MENSITNRYELFEDITGINLKNKFDAYGWYEDEDWKISKEEYWAGWWNEYFNFITVWAKHPGTKIVAEEVKKIFIENGYKITDVINHGFSISYDTMTREESKQKAYNNLMNGGRMSD